ncbi:hypothetical protein FRACYDRAFT_193086 [Fragilariopsis cylindrus CCMP1102]|uniref:DUF1995 domain-containing protein n=1 Tax=Fragilariopsis cylindrus CCMP1102 TaxID=635003 RepID=A0A1E7EYR6_9STRA|nr:hypothetical protein FRACYDRAFT_193086 [Fragilariopsis cylindrus CCMP1102]|eukprot:OEU11158.1 hypothetical protein FRACYDRAFT_193086 [Fragilariopsis cylindrus CCMP1102]
MPLQVSSRAVVVICTHLVLSVLLLVLISSSSSLVGVVNSFTLSSSSLSVSSSTSTSSSSSPRRVVLAASNTASSIPSSTDNRDKQAIDSTKKAIDKPRNSNFPLIELEFPPIQSLNKLGDGSLRSTIEVDNANLKFYLMDVLNPFKSSIQKYTCISSSSTNSFRTKAQKIATKGIDVIDSSAVAQEEDNNGATVGMVYIFISPSSRGDYMMAQQMANANICKSVVIVNGFAKGPNSISGLATMSYYLKPLTYNSQIAGYLIRSYPSLWTVLDSSGGGGVKAAKVLTTYTDKDILVQGTNTPDLRASGKLVQKSVDERAIAARSQR